jgi:PIN domain nuclease of toxin-antitoxin system
MKYLIDTQIVIWSMISPHKLEKEIRALLENNTIIVSQISLFEIAIKQKIGKLSDLEVSLQELIIQLQEDNFHILPIEINHIIAYEQLPLMQEHRDPFDRLILATAKAEGMTIISADEKFKLYSSYINLIEND